MKNYRNTIADSDIEIAKSYTPIMLKRLLKENIAAVTLWKGRKKQYIKLKGIIENHAQSLENEELEPRLKLAGICRRAVMIHAYLTKNYIIFNETALSLYINKMTEKYQKEKEIASRQELNTHD